MVINNHKFRHIIIQREAKNASISNPIASKQFTAQQDAPTPEAEAETKQRQEENTRKRYEDNTNAKLKKSNTCK